MNRETSQFIYENCDANVHELSLKSARFPLVDMSLAIRQINGKQKIKTKIPLFYNNNDLLYPVQLSLEQSSSESTAKYKSNLCEGNTLVDLTGGFGVDCYFLAERFRQVAYVERHADLCSLAEHNFSVLGRNNIEVFQADAEKYLATMEPVDWIFIDPARRSDTGKKVVFLSDCEPDVSALSSLLLQKATRVMMKLSPMMDITAALKELPTTAVVHIISVDNECKEVLLILQQSKPEKISIKTVNIAKNNENRLFEYDLNEESTARVNLTSDIKTYLYEPNASVMKSGGFKTVCNRFNLYKIHINTHLYTSSELSLQFPGRVFEVVKVWNNSKPELKELLQHVPKANITTRNYPIGTDELRQKLKIKEGGDSYLFACTLENDKKVIIECRKIIK